MPKRGALADRVLAEWTLSADEGVRTDGWALIDEFKIVNALPALEKLAERLQSSRAPGAPHELKSVNGILENLRLAAAERLSESA